MIEQLLPSGQPLRCYPKFLKKSKRQRARYGVKNLAFPDKAAVEFMQNQGLPRFDTNSGRKALARWCKFLNVPYQLSVHIHGDLQSNRATTTTHYLRF